MAGESANASANGSLNASPVQKRPAADPSGDSATRLDFPEPKRRLTAASPFKNDSTSSSNGAGTNGDYVEEISVPVRKPPQPTPLISRTRTRVAQPTDTPVKSPHGGVSTRRKSTAARRQTRGEQDSSSGGGRSAGRARKSTMGAGRRRSTFSMRGKRASSIGGGFKALPHDSVSAGDFYRHISPELPEPIRLRQLLAWCARRTPVPGDWPGDLPPQVVKILGDALREAVDDIHSAFEKGVIATSWYHRPVDSEKAEDAAGGELQKHPENVANAEAKEKLLARIAKLRAENEAWVRELKRASTEHAKAVDRLPKSIHNLPAPKEGSGVDVAIEPIARSQSSFDWSLLGEGSEALQYVNESNMEVIGGQVEEAESQIDQATREVEIQLDAFHLDMHRSNEAHEEAKRVQGQVESGLAFALAQRRAKALAIAGSRAAGDQAKATPSLAKEPSDDTRDLLRTLAATLASDS
ncbi:hypothetical protein GQ54DRAFT_306626 [Martensiomyces pterosporus]|nr:hypothetical protein GQ54DRAFT_306626 [Martensiomyces pterosporus]